MKEDYIEGRFGIVMEEIRDALVGIEKELEMINEGIHSLGECVDFRLDKPVLRVADITRQDSI